jgi:hypothetical protein
VSLKLEPGKKKPEQVKQRVVWMPQPGKQMLAAICPCDVIFFGGKRGSGKSDVTIGRQIAGAEKHADHWNGIIIRKKYKDLAEIRRRIDELIKMGMPAVRVGGDQQPNEIRFTNGARIHIVAIGRPELLRDYIGQQFTQVSVEEAPEFPWIAQLIDEMRACLRSAHGVPCSMFMTGNPGGPGVGAIKAMFIDKGPGGKIIYCPSGETRVFIPSSLDDNQILTKMDPGYKSRLESISNPVLRAAWLDGNWDIIIGQVFAFSREYHVCEPMPVPDSAPLYMTYDWGFGAPFSIGWWWVDSEGRLYRFAEWYGWDGYNPSRGLRLEDSRVRDGIIEKEKALGIWGRPITRLAGHDCWNKKPNYDGGGQGPSTSEVFSSGAHPLYLVKADPTRHAKIRQFHERLKIVQEDDGAVKSKPMLQVYNTCTEFIRTIPSLVADELNLEDVDQSGECHVYDDAAQVCMARPLSMYIPKNALQMAARIIEAIKKPVSNQTERILFNEQLATDSMLRAAFGYEQRDLIFEEYEGVA